MEGFGTFVSVSAPNPQPDRPRLWGARWVQGQFQRRTNHEDRTHPALDTLTMHWSERCALRPRTRPGAYARWLRGQLRCSLLTGTRRASAATGWLGIVILALSVLLRMAKLNFEALHLYQASQCHGETSGFVMFCFVPFIRAQRSWG